MPKAMTDRRVVRCSECGEPITDETNAYVVCRVNKPAIFALKRCCLRRFEDRGYRSWTLFRLANPNARYLL